MASELKSEFRSAYEKAAAYFDEAGKIATDEYESSFYIGYDYAPLNHYWDQLTDNLKDTARQIISKILPVCAKIAELTKSSPLTGAEDTQDVKLATKRIRAALGLRNFSLSTIEVLHDEGTVLGVRPPEQKEDCGLSPLQAKEEFDSAISMINDALKLIEASSTLNPGSTISYGSDGSKYRSGTAFIMMWMDPKNPDLTDVMDAVKDVFKSFDIRAVRADDIEHEGQITDRILNEIKTSEFLFADLTGMRPNVYYETGYAHALGKRVILFRKAGTNLHFDLAGYNCPEYENLRDLRIKLKKRLVSITNKQPKENEKI